VHLEGELASGEGHGVGQSLARPPRGAQPHAPTHWQIVKRIASVRLVSKDEAGSRLQYWP
jgi:hypothetical protein